MRDQGSGMERITLEEVVSATEGEVLCGKAQGEIVGVSTDTRSLKPGELFFALKGENHDGHDFIPQALKMEAAAVITSRKASDAPVEGGVLILVPDTLLALERLASWYRRHLPGRTIGVTGSNGKTTTKELLSAFLSARFTVIKSEENFNNEIGVPLTVFRLDRLTEVGVFELAMRGRGQIRELAEIIRPCVGVITNVGEAHYELLGSYRAIAETKAELLECLGPEGVSVLNADNEWFSFLKERAPGRVVTFGRQPFCDVRLAECKDLGFDGFDLLIEANKREFRLRLSLLGIHNVYNTLAAVAAGMAMGLKVDDFQKGLSSFRGAGRRMEILKTPDGVTILNDSYNASPASMKMALYTLAGLEVRGRRIALVGDMLELGEISQAAHQEIGRKIADANLDYLLTVGDLGELIYEEASRCGMPQERLFWFAERREAAGKLEDLLQPGDVVLVKASRKMRLDEVTDFLMKTETGCKDK